jgi:hypothetical protein
MTTFEITALAARLAINAPDMQEDYGTLLDALTSYGGHLSHAVNALVAMNPTDERDTKRDLAAFCGALILVLASIASKASINLEDAILEGSTKLGAS